MRNVHAVSSRRLVSSAEYRWLVISSIVVVLMASLPYLAGALAATPNQIFTGLQVNPLDGVSYLAKLRLGWNGAWLFQLRFTAEQGSGAFLFTYFIALGHLARLLNLPLIAMFHLARLIGDFVLLWMIYHLIARFTGSIDLRRRTWWLVALSSGLGWLAALLGHADSSDLTIAESNTFYSLMANAHFALATALMLAFFIGVLETTRLIPRRVIGLSALSIALAIIQPFAPFAVYAILGIVLLLSWRRDRSFPHRSFAAALIAGALTAPLLLYMVLATQSDPTLRVWSMQNQTPSPPPIDYVIGYGLLIVAAIPGARSAWQRRSKWDVLLIAWIVITVPLLYAPIPLQRRLSLGLHIPVAMLAAFGLSQAIHAKWLRRLAGAAMLPTSIFLIIGLISGAAAHNPHIYLTANEAAAFNWLQTNVPFDAVILAAPDTSAFIPAFAGQRVVYGHPYETVDADRKRQLVADFFAGKIDRSAVLRDNGVDYVMIGPREQALGNVDWSSFPVVFTAGDVTVYAVRP